MVPSKSLTLVFTFPCSLKKNPSSWKAQEIVPGDGSRKQSAVLHGCHQSCFLVRPQSVLSLSRWPQGHGGEEKTHSTLTETLPAPPAATPLWAFEQRLLLLECLFTSNWTWAVGATLLLSGKPPVLSFCEAVTQQGTSYLLNSECKPFPALWERAEACLR